MAGRALRSALLKGASSAALAMVLGSSPAHAQLAAMRAALGIPNNVGAGTPPVANTVTAVTPTMSQIMARHQSYQARVAQAAGLVAQANAAARAAAQAAAQSVRDGLGAGGLVPVANPVTSAQDPTGLNVWQGASQPTQTQNGTAVNVTINQTQSRALLSWNSFDIGRNTTLTFNQQGNSDWVAVNRVVGGINPTTGLLDPSLGPTPTQILGSIKADGSVYVLNRAGVMFGTNAQVNLHSLLASSLELGSASVPSGGSQLRTLSLQERNTAFLDKGLLPEAVSGLVSAVVGEQHGAVSVAQGAQITANGGYVILAAPRVSSAGEIKVTIGGQVSLEAGNQVDATVSTGAAGSADPNVRGLVLTSLGGGTVDVTGSIDAPQGYISLGTDLSGTVTMGGLLTSTTGVSRNGKISLIGGTVAIAPGAAIAITPDTGSDTIPQSADSVAAFKTSQIDIGSHYYTSSQGRISGSEDAKTSDLLPANITIGNNAIIEAPSANVSIGGRAGDVTRIVDEIPGLASAKVDVQANAVIDVSGVADYLLPASRNMLEISPAKRNELRDTPNYRETTTDGSFTLNGKTLFVDPRLSGVRDDGVAWIGSPLIEAGSLAAQIGVTAQELMTKGGNVTLSTLGFKAAPPVGADIPSIRLDPSATIDFSGGWVRYAAGYVHYSKLVTADGRIVDISDADPNDDYVAVGNGFVEQLPQLSTPIVHANSLLQGGTFEAGYVEGRDAGALTINTPAGDLNANLHGDAVAGERQIGGGAAASAAPSLPGDIRKLQAVNSQLPAAGLLHVQSIPGGGIVVGGPASPLPLGAIRLDDAMLDNASLGAVSLQTSGTVTFAASSNLNLAAGGALNVDAGRTISFNGNVSVPAGTITARTYGIQLGSLFDTGDDIASDGVLTTAAAPRMFDIVVGSGATLSARGRWVNDSLVTDGLFAGPGYTSGGAISLTSAPHVAAFKQDGSGAVDLSGSILLDAGSLLDVSGGGYISPTGVFSLSGKGGDVSLVNETSYFQQGGAPSGGGQTPTGVKLFRSDLTTFQLTRDGSHQPSVVPDSINATVTIDGDIRSFGFKGGGTFALVTPDLKFGSSDGGGTAVPLDFLQRTGFSTLSLTAWNTNFLDNVFSNGLTGRTALLGTEQVQIRAGETLNLTQSVLPSILSTSQINILAAQASGTDISRLAAFAPTNQLGDYDNLPANLILGGLAELDLFGGTIVGAPTASITVPKLYNAGTIRIAGGSILQSETLPFSYVPSSGTRAAIAIQQQLDPDGVDRGAGLAAVFGRADANGKYDENGANAAGFLDADGNPLSNRDLLALNGSDRQVYYLGRLGADQGIVLAANSVTDLSGISIRNPRASLLPGQSAQIATGRLIDGGSIRAAGLFVGSQGLGLFSTPKLSNGLPTLYYENGSGIAPNGARPALTVTASGGAVIDLSGAADQYDVQTGANSFTPTAVWSNAGALSALGGGDVTAATIRAHGGSVQALGGTFEWLDPVLVQDNASSAQSGVVSASQIEAAGFDSFVARGDLTTIGDVDLTLARSFHLRARDYSGAALSSARGSSGDTKPFADPYYAISMAATGALSITAPHIGLIGIDQMFDTLGDAGTQTGSLALHGGAIDIAGAVAFRNSLSSVLLDSATDIRLIGVQPLARTLTPDTATDDPSLSGQIIAGGDLLFRAGQVYATTGSGNLQHLVDTNGADVVRPFLIASAGTDATIRFEGNGNPTPAIPYSAGSYVSVQAPHIDQAGVLRAPLGRLDLGSASPFSLSNSAGSSTQFGRTETLAFEPGSITSVSAGNLSIPYGTTTDLTEYYFTPGSSSPLKAPPAAELRMGGDAITVAPGATIDGSGGGDLYAYEFVSGTGGSHDVLSRFNSDSFSTRNGFQYPDGRQVYAILPAGSSSLSALYDPIYSADYGALYGGDAGKMVHLEGGAGVPAGDYVLLPAQYALLPGAMRLVENVGTAAPLPGASAQLRDGSVIVAGSYGVAGTGLSDWQRHSFTVQSQDVFRKYSRIELTSGTKNFTAQAEHDGVVMPRLPADAARIVINPLSTLAIGDRFDTDPASGGRGSQVDIAGEIIDIVSPGAAPRDGAVTLVTSDLAQLNAASLLIGGVRTDKSDGSTDLRITAHEINVLNDVANPLQAPEVVLAVDGAQSALTVADGASIVASGTLNDTRSGDYNVAYFTRDGGGNIISDNSGAGSLIRIANGVERFVNRSGDLAASVTTQRVTLDIGQANFAGDALAIDTSRNLKFDAGSTVDVRNIAFSGDNISFSSRTFGIGGLVITPELEQTLSQAEKLSIRANASIGFTPGEHVFQNLSLDAPGIRLIRPGRINPAESLSVTITAANIDLLNSAADTGACRGNGGFACGSAGNNLILNTGGLSFGKGTLHTYGFDNSVQIAASSGTYYSGVGAFDVGSAALSLTTPFIADLGNGTVPKTGATAPDLELRTSGNVAIASGGTSGAPSGPLAPGGRLAIGSLSAPARSVLIDGTAIRATAGTIEVNSATDVTLSGAAALATPSYSQKFGDAADPVTVSAAAGTISLTALTGNIDVDSAATLSIGGLTGSAGKLTLLASEGSIALDGAIDAAAPGNGASLRFDSGLGGFDLPGFVAQHGAQFTGAIDIRTGAGDLALDAGQSLKLGSLTLTADGGSTRIGGLVDTSGINGGAIALFGRDGVSLASTAVLDAHASGYAESDTRSAKAGDVILGVGDAGAISVASGAAIDLSARRPGDRLVAQQRTDPRTLNQVTAYTLVEGDQGGTLTLRAPVISQAGGDTVNVDFAGAVSGARDVTVEGYRRYDLAAIATDGRFTGVSVDSESAVATLDLGAAALGKANFLADLALGTIVDFIQNFDISNARSRLGGLTSLASYHERPGVELDYTGGIALASNWNLGAGTVDVAGAVAAGDMRLSDLGPRADGSTRYEVVPGREADLFQRFVNLTYRVGGRVDGEAGRLTLRAGRDLNIGHSITDGFFAFSDQTDPDYLSTQLGGGTRTYNPALTVRCGIGGANPTDCDSVVPFALDTGLPTTIAKPGNSINFDLSNVVRGSEQLGSGIAPYSAAANAPAATGLFADGSGDPIGSAQLFPLLADGRAVDSFSIQLVGGAGASPSANPLHIDRGSGGNVIVSGETSYDIAAVKPTGQYAGALQLRYDIPNDRLGSQFIPGDFFNSLAELTGKDAPVLESSMARVTFGRASSNAADFMRTQAQAFFAAFPDQVQYFGPSDAPTGFTAPVGLVIRFLESQDASGVSLADRLAAKVTDGSFGYAPPVPLHPIDPTGKIARVHTLVRTGTGSIDVAAARDVDLSNGAPHLITGNSNNVLGPASNVAQEGGSAIYTAGHVLVPGAVSARVSGTQTSLTIDPANYALTGDLRDGLWVPTSAGRLQTNPVYATGGGSITLTAGQDVLGRRDVWSEAFNSNSVSTYTIGGIDHSPSGADMIGSGDQRWRVGAIGLDEAGNPMFETNIRINPQLFSSGIGTLGGGDVTVAAGHDVNELTVALDTSVTTGDVGTSFGSMVFGGGNLAISAGHDILGGRFDIATGTADISAGRDIGSSGKIILNPVPGARPRDIRVDNLPEIRITDTRVTLAAGNAISIGKVSALGVDSSDGSGEIDGIIDQNALGYYTGTSGISFSAAGDVRLRNGDVPSVAGGVALKGIAADFYRLNKITSGKFKGLVLPSTLEVTSFGGNIDLGQLPNMLYPSSIGQLSLLAGGTLAAGTIDLDDGDPSLLPGIFSALNYRSDDQQLLSGRPFSLPTALTNTSDAVLRLYHDPELTHMEDPSPARIAVGGDLKNLTLFMAKQTRISAGGDIIDMIFTGQNINASDATRIVAGRDITATTAGATSTNTEGQSILGRSIVQGNQFMIGGQGQLFIEAGRDLGPFVTSSVITDTRFGSTRTVTYPGGIYAVGNDFNPWLAPKSADVYTFFGIVKGMDFDGLRETYVNPANVSALDGDLFEQITDPNGNKFPDRTRPIYSPILIAWVQQNHPDVLVANFGTTDVNAAQAYAAFAALPSLVQRKFLLDDVYFNELAAPSRPNGSSYLQYVRGYRAVETLFPASLGYTSNDLSGDSNGGVRVSTGNLDLRLAAIETTRGSDITILGPGGNAVFGSVVRTSQQAARRAYQPTVQDGFDQSANAFRPTSDGSSYTVPVLDIPIGYEGVLTLRGGAIRGFTDGDFRLNQSRLFSQQSGDITLWSSNGDLNAGQGPKSAANVPPIIVRFDPDAFAEVDSAGAVTGAGIAGFAAIRRLNASTGQFELVDVLNDSDVAQALAQLQGQPAGTQVQINGKAYTRDAPTITLVAPAGTVDAGDAGVRAGGDIFVAAAQVANADNFKVGGSSVGIPSANVATAPALPANAASAITANVFRASQAANPADQRLRILVDVLGYYSGSTGNCPEGSSDPNCKTN